MFYNRVKILELFCTCKIAKVLPIYRQFMPEITGFRCRNIRICKYQLHKTWLFLLKIYFYFYPVHICGHYYVQCSERECACGSSAIYYNLLEIKYPSTYTSFAFLLSYKFFLLTSELQCLMKCNWWRSRYSRSTLYFSMSFLHPSKSVIP